MFACYTVEALNGILALIAEQHINFRGTVTWSSEFEDQPYFEGYRELATNGIDKPVLNVFRMFGLLGDQRVNAASSGSLTLDEIVSRGVRERPDINTIASRKEREVEILIWNYHDDDVSAQDAPIEMIISGIPGGTTHALLEHFRVDANHSNSFAAWKQMGSPQSPSPEQYQELEQAAQLQLLESPRWVPLTDSALHLKFSLPRQGLSLIRISW